LDLILDFKYFSSSNCNIHPNPTHLPKHQVLSPNHQFSQRIWYVECYSGYALWREVRNFAWHRWFSLQRCCKTFRFVCFS